MGSQGRPSCLRPTLGFGTQSLWDWGLVGADDVRPVADAGWFGEGACGEKGPVRALRAQGEL